MLSGFVDDEPQTFTFFKVSPKVCRSPDRTAMLNVVKQFRTTALCSGNKAMVSEKIEKERESKIWCEDVATHTIRL